LVLIVLKKKTIPAPNAVNPHVKSVANNANNTGLIVNSFSIYLFISYFYQANLE